MPRPAHLREGARPADRDSDGVRAPSSSLRRSGRRGQSAATGRPSRYRVEDRGGQATGRSIARPPTGEGPRRPTATLTTSSTPMAGVYRRRRGTQVVRVVPRGHAGKENGRPTRSGRFAIAFESPCGPSIDRTTRRDNRSRRRCRRQLRRWALCSWPTRTEETQTMVSSRVSPRAAHSLNTGGARHPDAASPSGAPLAAARANLGVLGRRRHPIISSWSPPRSS